MCGTCLPPWRRNCAASPPRHLRRLSNNGLLPRPIDGKVDLHETLEDYRTDTENGKVSGNLVDTCKQIEQEKLRTLQWRKTPPRPAWFQSTRSWR